MRIAILGSDYHLVRVMEMLLTREHHTVSCFGKMETLESSSLPFDLLIFDPGRPFAAPLMLARIADWRPEVRRLLFTTAYENMKLARHHQMRVAYWPCSRQLFLSLIADQKSVFAGGQAHGT